MKGKIKDVSLRVIGEKNTPLIEVFFQVEDGHVIPWSGWLSEKVSDKDGLSSIQRTLKKLVELGFTGSDLSELEVKNFNTSKEWDLVVDFKKDKNGMQTKFQEVIFFNDPDRQGGKKADKATALAISKQLAIKGELMKLQKEVKTDDIPF